MSTLADPQACSALLDRLARLQPDAPRRWGRMDAAQMVHHIGFACEAALGRVPFTVPDQPARPLMKWFALRAPLRWPQNIRTGADPAGTAVDPSTFTAEVARAVAAHRALAAASGGCAARHPIFGPMSTAEWQRWAWRHTDHHLRQFGA